MSPAGGRRYAAAASLLLLASLARAAPDALDDAGQTITLQRPAQRVVSLSPGITEMLFAIGAGEKVVAVSEYSDTPPAARALPRVARAQGIDLEKIAALKPDLVVTWGSGYAPSLIDALRHLGAPLYIHEARNLETIATSIERLGVLTAAPDAPGVAAAFRKRLGQLRARYSGRAPVRVFYQVWDRPLMTLGGGHLVNEILHSCGARSIFEALAPLVASVDLESVVAARPQLIIAAEPGARDRGALDLWRRYPDVPAVARRRLVTLDANALDRASIGTLDAMQDLCEAVERSRANN